MPHKWQDIVRSATELRHELHRHPEPTWQEERTAERVRGLLSELCVDWRPCAGTGTVATLAADASGAHVALRTDLDALPIQEASGESFASEREGCMHACGHDGHTATLYAAARWLKAHESSLPGPVSLLFQPAEEGGHGARRMIEEGALEGVDTIFGWHNWPAIPYGHAVCPDGPVMSANGTFRIRLRGRGGHASQPESCRDPVLAAAAVTLALQQVVSRRLPPQQPAVVSVASIDARSADTVIPERAEVGGSIRIADDALRDTVERCITQVASDTGRAYGVEVEVEHVPRYGSTVNHPEAARRLREALAAELGEAWRHTATPVPIMASEDFSYYLREIPGAFALVGAGEPRHEEPCHSPRYRFNDRLIPCVARVYARLAGAPVPP